MNNNFKVALLQLNAVHKQNDALLKGIEFCKKAKQLDADIVVFPEMWNTGYEMLFDGELSKQKNISQDKIDKWNDRAIYDNDNFIQQYKDTAKQLHIAIVLTFLERAASKPKNTAVVIDKNGNIILKYSKIHTVDFKMEAYIQPGNNFQTCELDYGRGKIKLGTMICFDRDFPESARILMLQGSEIILVPNACYMTKIRLDQLKVRAYENMVGIVCVNYSNLGGKSSAYSPIVRDLSKQEVDNTLLVMDDKEDIKVVEFDINEIRNYRKRETLGDAYRKPYAYKELIEDNVKEPFIRNDSRRK